MIAQICVQISVVSGSVPPDGEVHSIWEGPYEVIAKTSGCNYKIAVPGKKSKNTTVHIKGGMEDSYS